MGTCGSVGHYMMSVDIFKQSVNFSNGVFLSNYSHLLKGHYHKVKVTGISVQVKCVEIMTQKDAVKLVIKSTQKL